MNPVIRISDVNWERLKKYAQPFEDSPNDALTKILDQAESLTGRSQTAQFVVEEHSKGEVKRVEEGRSNTDRSESTVAGSRIKHDRLKRGLKMARSEFRIPVLVAVKRLGGTAARTEVVAYVGDTLKDKFSDYDLALLPSGGTRWEKDAHWMINYLMHEGLLEPGVRRGEWSLTTKGRAEV